MRPTQAPLLPAGCTRAADRPAGRGRLHVDPAAHRALRAAVPVGLLLRAADLLHVGVPCIHSAPLQQVLAPGGWHAAVRAAFHSARASVACPRLIMRSYIAREGFISRAATPSHGLHAGMHAQAEHRRACGQPEVPADKAVCHRRLHALRTQQRLHVRPCRCGTSRL